MQVSFLGSIFFSPSELWKRCDNVELGMHLPFIVFLLSFLLGLARDHESVGAEQASE